MNRILRFHATLRTVLAAGAWGGLATAVMAQATMPPAAVEPLVGAQFSATGRVAVEAAFTLADLNGDGSLSREEVARLPAIAARFDELDDDKDGVLSLEEFAAGATVDPK